MDATYTMIGADGLQYGPITLEQLKGWITEGRVTGETKILRSDTNSWLPAANYTELGLVPAIVAPPPLSATPAARATPPQFPSSPSLDPLLARRVRIGASWFYSIAIFSVVNYFLWHNTGSFFLIGMGVTLKTSGVVPTAVVSAIFAIFGYFAGRAQSWAFIVGMVLYALDGLIFVQDGDWLCVAFHAYAIFRMFMGLKANLELKAQSR